MSAFDPQQLAMGPARRGQAAEANAELARTRELLQRKTAADSDLGDPAQGFWFDWGFAREVPREAATQIEP